MFLTIDLRDNENMTVKSVKLEIQAQETISELKDKIASEVGIEKIHQQIFDSNDRRIDNSTSFENAGIQDNETLVLKHYRLESWEKYKEYVGLVLEKCSEKIKNARNANTHHWLLTNSSFFEVYPHYDNFQREKQPEIDSWANSEDIFIRQGTEQYFRNLHDQRRGNENSELICFFENLHPYLGDYSTNHFVSVQMHGEESVSKYNISFHYYDGRYSIVDPDVIELYIYKLLELIGVGHKRHIIPPAMWNGAKTSVYIANQWDDNVENLDKLWEEDNLSADVVVQLSMLEMLLVIKSLHSYNCGRWKGTENVAVIGFSSSDIFNISDNPNYEMKRGIDYSWSEAYSTVRNQHDVNSWLKIGKVYFDKWDLSSNIKLAREQLDPTNELLKQLDIEKGEWQESRTQQLDEYIDELSKRVENFQTFLNSIE